MKCFFLFFSSPIFCSLLFGKFFIRFFIWLKNKVLYVGTFSLLRITILNVLISSFLFDNKIFKEKKTKWCNAWSQVDVLANKLILTLTSLNIGVPVLQPNKGKFKHFSGFFYGYKKERIEIHHIFNKFEPAEGVSFPFMIAFQEDFTTTMSLYFIYCRKK